MTQLQVSSQGKDGNWDINVNQTQQGAPVEKATPQQVSKDSLQTAEKGAPGAVSLLAELPILEVPDPNAPPFKQLNSQDFAKMPFIVQNPNDLYKNLFKGQLADLQLNQQVTPEQAGKLEFGFFHPTDPSVVKDSSLQGQLQQISDNVKAKMESQLNRVPDNTTPDPKEFDNQVMQDYDASFQQAVQEAVSQMNLPEDQAQQLIAKTIFAFEHPDQVNRSPTDLASQLEKTIAQQMVEKYGLPPDYQFKPDTQSFDSKLSVEYNGDFNTLLSGNLENNPELAALLKAHPELAQALKNLTPEQLAQLKYLHYHPDAHFPNGEALKGLNAQLQTILLGNLINEFGFPPGWQPKVDKKVQDAVITGYYREAFFKKLDAFAKAQVPPLTEAQLKELKDAFDKPNDPSVSSENKKIIENLSQQAIEEIRPQLGLPVGWVPPVGPVTGGSLDPESATIALNAINNLDEMISGLKSLAMQLPNTPMRQKILDFLKAISQALSQMKEEIFAMQGVDAAIAKQLGKAELDTNLNKLEKQRQEMEKQKESGKPGMEIFQKFMQAFGPCAAVVAIIMAVVTMGTASAIAIAVAVVAIVYTVADAIIQATTGKGIMGWVMEGVTQAVKAMTKGAPPGLTLAIDIIVKVVLIAVFTALVIWANPMIGLTVGVQAAGQAVTEGKIIQNLVREMGGDQMAQEITAMVLVTVVTVACAMGAMIYGFFQQSVNIGAQVAEKASEVVKKVGDILKLTAELIAKIQKIIELLGKINPMDIAMIASQATDMALTMTQQSIVLKSQLDQAKLVLEKARLMADIEVMNAMLKMLRKLINSLMSGMPIQGDMAAEIDNIQKNLWGSMSKITSNIASSGAA